ncbi:MAG: 4Fe-4S dicluster domain-containing protein [Phycisphaerae bacterium]|nr:4Fe-4S dicluster domain-containing protein [Phycisphaerae bacterium]
MLFQRYGKFTGGIDVPEEKDSTVDKPISIPEATDSLRIPLMPCQTLPSQPTVTVGARIEPHQRIAAAMKDGIDIFAPLGGTVKSIDEKTIELADLTQPKGIPESSIETSWSDLDSVQLYQRLAESHLPTFGARGETMMGWINRAKKSQANTLIINAVECQPYVTADHRLLAEFGSEVITGSAILGKTIGVSKIIVAVDETHTDDYTELLETNAQYDIQCIALPRKYPIGADNILAYVLTRHEVPCGQDPESIGIAMAGPAECFSVYRWVVCGQRLGGRVVTISGMHAERPGNYFVPYGTDIHELMAPAEEPFIIGSPMIGRLCPEGSVVKPSTDAVVAIDPTIVGVPSQCIRCGWCHDHCPARLNVAVLNDHYELSDIAQAEHLGVLSCVECGVCSYICPARLPLAERTRKLKRAIKRRQTSMPLFTPAPKPPESDR